jgi:hypothetical protein
VEGILQRLFLAFRRFHRNSNLASVTVSPAATDCLPRDILFSYPKTKWQKQKTAGMDRSKSSLKHGNIWNIQKLIAVVWKRMKL